MILCTFIKPAIMSVKYSAIGPHDAENYLFDEENCKNENMF